MSTAKKLVVPVALFGLVYIITKDSAQQPQQEHEDEPVEPQLREHIFEDGSREITTKTGVRFRVPYFKEDLMVYFGVTEKGNLASFTKLVEETAEEYANDSMYDPSLPQFADKAIEYYRHSLISFKDFVQIRSKELETIKSGVKEEDEEEPLYANDVIMKMHVFLSQFLQNWGDPNKSSPMTNLLGHVDKEILKRNELLSTGEPLFKVAKNDERVLTFQEVETQRAQLQETKTFLELQLQNAKDMLQIVSDVKREWNWVYPSVKQKKTDYSSFPFGTIRTGIWIASTKLKNTFDAVGAAGQALGKLACRPKTAPSGSLDEPRLNNFTQASTATVPQTQRYQRYVQYTPHTPQPGAQLAPLPPIDPHKPNFSAVQVVPQKISFEEGDRSHMQSPVYETPGTLVYQTLGGPPEIDEQSINKFIRETNNIIAQFRRLMKTSPEDTAKKNALLERFELLAPVGYDEGAVSQAMDFKQAAVTLAGSNVDYFALKQDPVYANYERKLNEARGYNSDVM